jgi:cytochrome P450
MILSDKASKVVLVLATGSAALVLAMTADSWLHYVLKYFNQHIPSRSSKRYIPHAGLWYIWLHIWDTRSAARKLYAAYKDYGAVKVTGPSFQDEVLIFDLDDCLYCHRNEGRNPGGAGDILFSRQTSYFGGEGPGLGRASHGRHMFGRGHGHDLTRELSNTTPMRSSQAVLESAQRCVDHVESYPAIMDWVRFHQIDMFMSVMIGLTPDLANPETLHQLRQLPEDEEHAFVSGLLLSILPWWMTTSLDKKFVKAMDNMTGLGVKELRARFLALPPVERPESFMKSLLEKGTEQDAEQYMALFITAFQGNISLTLQNIIFHLANCPAAQERLHQECVAAYDSGDAMNAQMPYLLAVHKESHRLTPITDITQVREYDCDLTLPSSGFQLTAGTRVMMLNQWSTRDPDLVPNVDEFTPERYLGPGVDRNLGHFLQFSEFGSSSRSCLGRRTAKVMLKSVIIELFRRYRLEATPACKTFRIDPRDPAFNRIKDFPKIQLHLRA